MQRYDNIVITFIVIFVFQKIYSNPKYMGNQILYYISLESH